MEASRFGFNLPPSYKFDPTDTDIVAHYLLPRAAGFPTPYAHAVVDADPCSCPPWELMRRHGHDGTDQALFFGPARDPDSTKRANRTVAAGVDDGVGGTWDGQKSELTRLVLLRGGGGGGGGEVEKLEITYKRHHLSYYHDDGVGKRRKKKKRSSTSGWVMYDYQIVDPEHLSGTVLSRIKITDRTKKKKKKQSKRKKRAAADEQFQAVLAPGPDQAGPSNYYAASSLDQAGPSNFYAVSGLDQAGPSNWYAASGLDQAGPSNCYAASSLDQAGPSNCYAMPGLDQAGPSNYYAASGTGPSNYYAAPPVTGGEEYGGFFMGDDMGGGCYVGGGSNHSSYKGYGCYSNQVGGGECIAAGDEAAGGGSDVGGGGSFAAGDFMGEATGGSYVGGGDDYLNIDFGSCFGAGDDYGFDFGNNSGFGYPDVGNKPTVEVDKQRSNANLDSV